MDLHVSHIVNSVFTSRTYILSIKDSREFWMVDCGDVNPLLKVLEEMSGGSFVVKGVLLTHVHYDHIYGLPQLTERFPLLKVFTNTFGRTALANERINMSRYHEDPINYKTENVLICDDGSVIELFNGIKASVHSTPGHNPSCLTYEIGKALFTGDSYIPGVAVVTNLAGGNKLLALQSLEKIKKLAEGKVVYPGHEAGIVLI